ncbi:mitochondrial carrier protein [Colletotrichum tofieldiae]|nr:mitochondrial carrier protein [Colletotrichum tofieldiae]
MPRAQEERPQRLVKRYRTEIAASTSSMFSTVVAFPLDSVKTRMQTYRYEGFLDCVRHTYRTEKLRGFFRRAKCSYSGWIKNALGFDVLQHVNKKGTYPNLYSIACFGAAGATAGSCITLLACPFELTKLSAQVSVLLSDQQKLKEANCRATNGHQVAASYQNKGTFKTMRNIIRHRGALGLYTGFNLHLLRDTLGTAIYFMVYESGKQLGTTFGGDHPTTNKLSVVISGVFAG